MRRSSNLMPKIVDYDNLLLAFWKASKGKRYATQVLQYQEALEDNLRLLGHQIVGYRLFPNHIRLLQQSKQRFIKKAGRIHEKYISGEWTEAECQRHVLPLVAFTEHCDSLNFRKKVYLRLNGQSS